jgi:hypothetical protein
VRQSTPSKYTPEFLRNLLAWEGDTCAMPRCGRLWTDRLGLPSTRAEWHVCLECWRKLGGHLQVKQRQYEQTQWKLEKPRELRCFICDDFGSGKQPIEYSKNVGQYTFLRHCYPHSDEARNVCAYIYNAKDRSAAETLIQLERLHYSKPTWGKVFRLLAVYKRLNKEGEVSWHIHRRLTCALAVNARV